MAKNELGGGEDPVALSSLLEPMQPNREREWERSASGAEVHDGWERDIL